uniref:Uncharacterized protein n=1 Tax=Gopherus agassizii TaxID=38772 RepID=A0A452HY65_9SAUR
HRKLFLSALCPSQTTQGPVAGTRIHNESLPFRDTDTLNNFCSRTTQGEYPLGPDHNPIRTSQASLLMQSRYKTHGWDSIEYNYSVYNGFPGKCVNMYMCFVFFLRSEAFRKVPYHYYEPGRDECDEYFLHENAPYGGHRFITEKKVFAKWAKKHTIIFTHPNWTLS